MKKLSKNFSGIGFTAKSKPIIIRNLKFLSILTFVFLCSLTSYGQVYNVTGLVAGTNVSEAQKLANSSAINNTIIAAGQAGGGTVQIPAGTYSLTAPTWGSCIMIDYDNITLKGAGKTQTTLMTRGNFVPGTPGGRANGIRIVGTASASAPRKNITISDMEMNGGAGWTGTYTLDYTNGVDDGWDMSHKGIILAV